MSIQQAVTKVTEAACSFLPNMCNMLEQEEGHQLVLPVYILVVEHPLLDRKGAPMIWCWEERSKTVEHLCDWIWKMHQLL
jgi:hypothetical protein